MRGLRTLVLAVSLAASAFAGLPAEADPPVAELPLPVPFVGIVGLPDDLASGTARAAADPSRPRYTVSKGWTCTDTWEPNRQPGYHVYTVTCSPSSGGEIHCSEVAVTVDARGKSGSLEGWSYCQMGLASGAYAYTNAPGTNSNIQAVNDTTPFSCKVREGGGDPRPWTVTCSLN